MNSSNFHKEIAKKFILVLMCINPLIKETLGHPSPSYLRGKLQSEIRRNFKRNFVGQFQGLNKL